MKGIKRSRNDIHYDNNNTKKQKLESHFEHIANEIIYEIFEYLDVYHIYRSFFYLNQRYRNLIIHPNLSIQINISTISKTDFESYHNDLIKPNQHRINYLSISHPFINDIIFSSSGIISQFLQIKTLILNNIDRKCINTILKDSIDLPKLQFLSLNLIEYDQSLCVLFRHIFRLPKLKSCKLTYELNTSNLSLPSLASSPIEYLTINGSIPFEFLIRLLNYLPQLRYLSIDYLASYDYRFSNQNSVILKHFKYLSLNLYSIEFNQFEFLMKSFFPNVEILYLTTKPNQKYFDAKQWENFIIKSLPKLRIFDIQFNGNILINHHLLNDFNSSFWTNRQWFFTHYDHLWERMLDTSLFYSTNPYRRNDYKLYWKSNNKSCPYIQEYNLNVVKHVDIYNKQTTNNSDKYFPNAIEVTIRSHLTSTDDLLSTTLNRILPLKQLIKLNIRGHAFPFEEIIKLLNFTPNLRMLYINEIYVNGHSLRLFEDDSFQELSKTNKIQNFELKECCSLDKLKLIIKLFPQMEYLKIESKQKEIAFLIRYLFSKTTNKPNRLFNLCIKIYQKKCLEELKTLFRVENLLDNYFIKWVKRELYLSW